MNYTCKPDKISIYVNSSFKTIDQIQAETQCDIIINGGLFNSDWTACCHLKADGKLIAADQWTYFGYGWHKDKADLRLTSQYSDLDNYICCVCLVRNGQKEALDWVDENGEHHKAYPSGMGGARPRTAIGVYPDGRIWFYAASEPLTPESLQSRCVGMGLDSALMLDGGGSTQGICPSSSYRQSRKCHNYICAWLKNAVTPTNPCPYQEPTTLQSRWSYTREGARWVQWHLNYHGAKLAVDGIIGGKTHAAIMAFQSDHKLGADGIVGSLTRAAMKQYAHQAEPDEPINIIEPNYVWNGTPVKRSSTQYIILHHAAADCTAMQTHLYHRDTKGWIGIGYNFFVAKDGGIYAGRPIDTTGAHCVGYNNKSVGICFAGNFEQEQMSAAQKEAGRKLVKYVKSFYPSAVVKRHKDLDATACPGKYFPFTEIAGGG